MHRQIIHTNYVGWLCYTLHIQRHTVVSDEEIRTSVILAGRRLSLSVDHELNWVAVRPEDHRVVVSNLGGPRWWGTERLMTSREGTISYLGVRISADVQPPVNLVFSDGVVRPRACFQTSIMQTSVRSTLEEFKIPPTKYSCLGGAVVERWTRDRKVACSTPGRGGALSSQLGQLSLPSLRGR